MSDSLKRSSPLPELWVCHLGTVPYRDALAIQEHVRRRRQEGELPDTLLLLEHPPVYTRGRRTGEDELPLGEDVYRAKGIEVLATDRGGRVTYHGPGQLVGYPIMHTSDIGSYLRTMEVAIIAALAREGIQARSRCAEGPDYTGVWVKQRKIASIGVHVSRGITTHGFAVNVDLDLEPFSWVIACGLPGREHDLDRRGAPRRRERRGGLLPQGDGLSLLRGARTAPAPRLGSASRHRHNARRRARVRASPDQIRAIPAG